MPVWSTNAQFINLTENAVSSLGDCELILIDNGSTYGAGQLREWASLYIRNQENLGYAKAVNQGLKLCEPNELVAIANNDIRVSPNWQIVAKEIFNTETDNFHVVEEGTWGMAVEPDEVGSVHFRMIPYDQPFNSGNDTWVGGKERWCTSSFFVVRNVQLYDENFFNTYEDWDFWKRMRKNYKQAYTNKVEYQHMDSFTQQFVPEREVNDKKNREYFKEKHGGYPEDLFEKEFPGELAKAWRPFP